MEGTRSPLATLLLDPPLTWPASQKPGAENQKDISSSIAAGWINNPSTLSPQRLGYILVFSIANLAEAIHIYRTG